MFDGALRRIAIPCVWLAGLHLAVLCASFVAPYDPTEQKRDRPFLRSTPIHVFDSQANYLSPPFVCRIAPDTPKADQSPASFAGRYAEDCSQKFPVRWFAQRSVNGDSSSQSRHLFGVDEPGAIHLLGTDQYGRDQFSRFLHGGKLSLFAGLLASVLAMTVGTIAGAIAGYLGGFVDAALMWASDVFLSLPWLFFLFGLRAFLPLDMEALTAFAAIIIALGVIGWPRPARLVRNVVLSAKERDYVMVARGLGAGHVYLLSRHILPATLSVVLTHAALLAPRYILAEITLTFFGLGVNEPAASWGQMFALLLQYFRLAPVSSWMYIPLICLVVTCFSYLSLADFSRRHST